MPFRLIASPLAAARAPLDGLRLRGWVHAGQRPLDGLLMDGATGPPDWRGAIRPWLDDAAEVRRHGDLVLVLFVAPRLLDCAALGPFVGVMRHGASLAAAPYGEPEPALAASLRDHLVLVRQGSLQALPLGAFEALDVAGWWRLDAVDIVARRPVPGVSRPKVWRASTPSVSPDPQADTVFADIRAALRKPARRGLRRRLGDLAASLRHVPRRRPRARAMALSAGIAGFILGLLAHGGEIWSLLAGLWKLASSQDGSASVLLWILIAILVATVIVTPPAGRSAGASGGVGGGAGGGKNGGGRIGWLRRLASPFFRGYRPANGAARPSGGASVAPPQNLRRDALWKRLGAWLAWHSPIGAGIRRQYAERVADIERLFAAGRLDEALRKALKLTGTPTKDGGAFGDLPLTGPGLRERLEFDLSGQRVRPLEALAGNERARLEALYRLHARELAKVGDVDRGAFILAELLDASIEAARLLADHGRFETAARLGAARRLAPGFIIPLWFKAGHADRALALAAQHDLFAELCKEVGHGDPFRDRLAEAWCERLADAGAYERAADLSLGVPTLAARRLDWILRAVEGGERPPPNALARALVALDWRDDPADRLFARFRDCLAEPGPDGAARRLALAGNLVQSGFEPRRRQDGERDLRLITHTLARSLAVDEGLLGHLSQRAETMTALAEAGQHFALRQDLRKLRKLPKPKLEKPHRHLAVDAGPPLAAIAEAVMLADRQVLIGYESGLLRLVDAARGGHEVWRGQVNGFVGLVPVGEGFRVLVLRQAFDEVQVLVFALDARRLTPWGVLPILAWDRQATETGWAVFGQDGAFTMLDTACLLRPPSTVEPLAHHWSIAMSEPGDPLVLLRGEREAVLVYARRDGLVEWWRVDLRTLKVDCRFWTSSPKASEPPVGAPKAALATGHAVFGLGPTRLCVATAGVAALGRMVFRDDEGAPVLTHRDHLFASSERGRELELLKALRAEPERPRLAPLAALSGSSQWAAIGLDGAMLWCGRAGPSDGTWSVALHGTTRLQARFSADDTAVVIHDSLGRLVALDLRADRVLLLLK